MKYFKEETGRIYCSLSMEEIDARLVFFDCFGKEENVLTVFELAKRYYPRLWDKSRLEALVEAGRLSPEELLKIIGEKEE